MIEQALDNRQGATDFRDCIHGAKDQKAPLALIQAADDKILGQGGSDETSLKRQGQDIFPG